MLTERAAAALQCAIGHLLDARYRQRLEPNYGEFVERTAEAERILRTLLTER